VILEPRAADLDLADLETALLRAAVGDYSAEAAVLLLANAGHWLPQLQAAGLISLLDDVALLLAAVAHAGGSHGDDQPPLAAWPVRG
jgi:hypothetical protein